MRGLCAPILWACSKTQYWLMLRNALRAISGELFQVQHAGPHTAGSSEVWEESGGGARGSAGVTGRWLVFTLQVLTGGSPEQG